MFYDTRLMKSKTIRHVWKAAHNIRDSKHSKGRSIHKICTKLESLVECEEQEASRRLSLRTSSTLVSGAAKLYKRQLEELLTDFQYTADSMRGAKYRRKQRQGSDDQDRDLQRSGSKTLPDMSVGDHRSSSSARQRQAQDHHQDYQELNPEMVDEMDMSPKHHGDGSPRGAPENSDQDRSKTVTTNSKRSSTVTRKNANTQTSLEDVNTEAVDPDAERGKAEPYPFVCAIIYENSKTAVPTKILLSSINPKILK